MNRRISRHECAELFKKYNTPAHVIGHCKAVSFVATTITRKLNEHGFNFDIALVEGAALAHDVARTSDRHDLVGAQILREHGFADEADIIELHMKYKLNSFENITETDLVCLGDRLVIEDNYVGLDKRMEYVINKVPKDKPEVVEMLLKKKEEDRIMLNKIEETIGQTIDSLFTVNLDNLLKRVEKPARYIGGENNIARKYPGDVKTRFAFAFPDLYEIGMSYMGLQILYHNLNKEEDIYCERVFAPAVDMEQLMRANNVPLYTLETKTPVKEMDFFGFTLQYEMSFTNILNMLELAGIPLLSKDRSESDPIIIAGGPCAYNPEPIADFVDIFMIGDGEISLPRLLKKYGEAKERGVSKAEFYKEIACDTGVYIPSFYNVIYNEDGTVKEYKKNFSGAPDRVERCIIDDIENIDFPVEPIVPLIETVHDRSVVETFRGCTRGCRFCQAGMIYRPVRERSKDKIIELAKKQLANTGHEELSLLSLSTSDYSQFEPLAIELMQECKSRNVSLSLPSLRLDTFSFNVLEEIQGYKKSGLTFAPEAGTQRLRDVINKGITEKDIYDAVEQAIELGWKHIKLYFMIGLPTETYEDLDGIAEIARNIVSIHRNSGKGGRFNVTVSVSNFVPKAHTPFQWASQNTTEEFTKKHNYLREKLNMKSVTFNYHDDAVSTYEAVFARGDRRLSSLLTAAHEAGCKLDSWSEHFDNAKWKAAIEKSGTDIDFYTTRERSFDEYCLGILLIHPLQRNSLFLRPKRLPERRQPVTVVMAVQDAELTEE